MYTREEPTNDGSDIKSYLAPIDFDHARKLLNGDSKYLDWNSPDTVKNRADLYLKDGFPIRDVLMTHRTILDDYREFRNHFAHNSDHSLQKFKNVIRRQHFYTLPISIPSLGQYLLLTARDDKSRYYLQMFFDNLELIASELKR